MMFRRVPAALVLLAALAVFAPGCISQEITAKFGEGLNRQFEDKGAQIDGAFKSIGDAFTMTADRSSARFQDALDSLAQKYEERPKPPELTFFGEDAAPPGAAPGAAAGVKPGETTGPPPEIKSDLLSERTLEHRGLRLLWKLALDGTKPRLAELDGGQLYVVTTGNRLYSIESTTGLTRWIYNLEHRPDGAPGYSDDYVVISAGDTIRVIDRKLGKDKWKFDTSITPSSRPACTSAHFVFGCWNGDVNGFAYGDLHARWTLRATDRVFSAPALQGGFAFAAADNGAFTKYNIAARMNAKEIQLGGRPVGDCLGTKDLVFIGTENYEMIAIRTADGTKSWSHGSGGRVVAGPWLAPKGDVLYYAAHDDGLYALTAATGKQRWKLAHGLKPVAANGDSLFVLLDDGTLAGVESGTGKIIWSESSAPFVAAPAQLQSTTIFLLSEDSQVFALTTVKK